VSYLAAWEVQPGISRCSIRRKVEPTRRGRRKDVLVNTLTHTSEYTRTEGIEMRGKEKMIISWLTTLEMNKRLIESVVDKQREVRNEKARLTSTCDQQRDDKYGWSTLITEQDK
jgi:hypothetical protein